MIHITKIVAGLLVLMAVALGIYAWLLGHRLQAQPQAPETIAPLAAPAEIRTTTPQFPVVVTTRMAPAGQPIAADALRVVQLPIQPAGTFSSAEDIVGRAPTFDLSEGTPLVENQLATGLAQRLADGERAVAVRADEVMGVGNRVQPGDYVDVFVVLKSDGRDIVSNQARLLLSRKRVLAFGATSVENMQQNAPQSQGRSEAARTAVLAVPVAEISRLALGENGGHLLLALRNPGDTAEPEPALFDGLTSTYFAPPAAVVPTAPARRTAAAQPTLRRNTAAAPLRTNEVEFFRGDRRETLTY